MSRRSRVARRAAERALTAAEAARTGGALPEAFLARLSAIVPPERLDAVVASFAAPQPTGFRVNTLRADEAATLAALAEAGVPFAAVDGVPGAFTVPPEARAALLASAPYAAGHVYVQNVSSQLPVVALDPQPGERILDLCAAPGSKTGQIVAATGGQADVTAIEKVRTRAYKLRANLLAQGADGVDVRTADGAHVWRDAPEAFDRVLLDAPCSTEGRFRADDPETTRYWSERKVQEMRAAQRRLLVGAVQALRPGGTLVYATCTFAPEENEGALARALRTFGDAIEVVDAGIPLAGAVARQAMAPLGAWRDRTFPPDVARALRVLPGEGLEAFFVARLVKHRSTLGTAGAD